MPTDQILAFFFSAADSERIDIEWHGFKPKPVSSNMRVGKANELIFYK